MGSKGLIFMKKNNTFLLGVMVVLLIPLFSAPAAAVDDTSLSDVISAGMIVVGLEAGYPPFEVLTPGTTDESGLRLCQCRTTTASTTGGAQGRPKSRNARISD